MQLIIEMAKVSKSALLLATVLAVLFFNSCGTVEAPTSIPEPVAEKRPVATLVPTATPQAESEQEVAEKPWSDEDVAAIVLTLAGECYDDKTEDKRLVCEVILNRVSAGIFGGDTVLEVVSGPNQFDGYWLQSRPVSENDYEVAETALADWYATGCQPLSDLLFFEAGENRENVFRSEY